jgi:hypothetical protein
MFEKILKYGVKGMHKGIHKAKPATNLLQNPKGVKTTPETTMSNAPEYKERVKGTPKFTVHYKNKENGERVEMPSHSDKEAKNHLATALRNGHSEIDIINHAVHPYVPK